MAEQSMGQLPLLPLVARSYAFVLMGLRPLLAATWPWIGVVYIAGRAATGVSSGLTVEDAVPSALWIMIVTNLVASSAVSVLCHRMIILGEWPLGLRSVHFGRREFHYLLALLGVGFTVACIMLLFTALLRATGLDSRGGISVSAVVIASITSLVLYARVSLAFPDLAVSEKRVPWHVWRASRGQTARIILGMALSGMPSVLIVQQMVVIVAILQVKGLTGIAILVDILGLIVTFVAIMSSAAFLSFAYQLLVLGSARSSAGRR
ncbi:hypothetical protein RIEGSTA812A_PEG_597 [invertebrate metagenome]|uniref:Glycerophosphoryl diester phosphodiesterase membrane domain-containing protein n=1 Tax=invertebrate metagenome TaxID=1711999 RepID=A0A484H6E3_9ZZZZ